MKPPENRKKQVEKFVLVLSRALKYESLRKNYLCSKIKRVYI